MTLNLWNTAFHFISAPSGVKPTQVRIIIIIITPPNIVWESLVWLWLFFFYYHSFFSYLHLLNFGTCTLTLFNNKHALHLWYVMSLILLFFDEIVWNLYCWHILRVTTLICLAWSKIQNHQPARACLCPSFWLDNIKTSITF